MNDVYEGISTWLDRIARIVMVGSVIMFLSLLAILVSADFPTGMLNSSTTQTTA